jgi:hypothetical protein
MDLGDSADFGVEKPADFAPLPQSALETACSGPYTEDHFIYVG